MSDHQSKRHATDQADPAGEPVLAGAAYNFVRGGGECGALIRARDWSTTSLGPMAEWPPSLHTAHTQGVSS